jgi:hypothetical protein
MIKITIYEQTETRKRCEFTNEFETVRSEIEQEIYLNFDHVLHISLHCTKAYIKLVNGDVLKAKMFVNTDIPFCFYKPKKEEL